MELEQYCKLHNIVLSRPNGQLMAITPDGTIFRRSFGEDEFLKDLKTYMTKLGAESAVH